MASPSDRSEVARIAANARWAKEDDRTAATATARQNSPASLERWMDKVDPDGRMPRAERLKRATNAKAVYYQTLMRKARQAKAKKAGRAA
jgi:hypothetical protein